MDWSYTTTAGTTFAASSTIYIGDVAWAPPPPPPPKPDLPVYVNPYVVLELPPSGASKTAVKQAYRKLAKENHPDVGGDPEKMALINAAFAFLKERGLA